MFRVTWNEIDELGYAQPFGEECDNMREVNALLSTLEDCGCVTDVNVQGL